VAPEGVDNSFIVSTVRSKRASGVGWFLEASASDAGRPGGAPPQTRCVSGTQRTCPRASNTRYLGITTVSMTWMTPLSAMTSVAVTVALSTMTLPPSTLTVSD